MLRYFSLRCSNYFTRIRPYYQHPMSSSMLITDDEILNPNIPDLPSKKEVIRLCRKHRSDSDTSHLTYPSPNGRTFFIKYRNASMAEARTQLYLHDRIIAARPRTTIRIPEIYHALDSNSGTYMVMEYIDIQDFASDKQRAKAIAELTSIEPPPDAAPGPIGGGRVKHKFFKYSESPVEYRSVSELDNHVNNVLKTLHWMHRNHPGWDKEPKTVDFSTEKLICYYSDIYRHNFPVDKQGQVWVVDFDHASVLPASFMSFALDLRFKDPLPPALRAALILNIERTKNLRAIQKAFRIMQMTADDLGLSTVPDYEPP